VNERALTIYLWHAAALFCMYQLLWAKPHSALERDILALPIVVCVTFLAVLVFGWAEDIAAGRKARFWPSRPGGGPARRRSRWRLVVPAGAAAGVVAVLIGVFSIAAEPASVVQPGVKTVPASGLGLKLRTSRAQILPGPPQESTTAGESVAVAVTVSGSERVRPVTPGELQSELVSWLEEWRLPGTAVSLARPGDGWTGATGVHENGGRFLPDEQYWIGSITKTFTAALVLRLAEQGLLDLDDPVSNFVPEFPGSELFSVRNLLQHTSGLNSFDDTPIASLISASETGFLFRPGTAFEYSRTGYYLLGLIIEDRLGKPYTRVLHDELLEPLALRATPMDEEIQPLKYSTHPYGSAASGYWSIGSGGATAYVSRPDIDYRGIHWSSAGLFSTPADMSHWALALWGSDSVIAPERLDAMTSFLGVDFDYTGLGAYAICPCWLDGDRLRSERWGHLGPTGAIEYDPAGEIALAVNLSGSVTEENVIEALDDLSGRLRNRVRGRPILPEAPDVPQPSVPALAPGEQRGCDEIAGTDYTSEAERRWFVDNCLATPFQPLAGPRSCEDIAGTRYFSELERLFFLSECS